MAIALIGRSPLLFLDEPSAAVDAGAKRHLWKATGHRHGQGAVEDICFNFKLYYVYIWGPYIYGTTTSITIYILPITSYNWNCAPKWMANPREKRLRTDNLREYLVIIDFGMLGCCIVLNSHNLWTVGGMEHNAT